FQPKTIAAGVISKCILRIYANRLIRVRNRAIVVADAVVDSSPVSVSSRKIGFEPDGFRVVRYCAVVICSRMVVVSSQAIYHSPVVVIVLAVWIATDRLIHSLHDALPISFQPKTIAADVISK